MLFIKFLGFITAAAGSVVSENDNTDNIFIKAKLPSNLADLPLDERQLIFNETIWGQNNFGMWIASGHHTFDLKNYPLDKQYKKAKILEMAQLVEKYSLTYEGKDGLERFDEMSDYEFDKTLTETLTSLTINPGNFTFEVRQQIQNIVDGIPNGGQSIKAIIDFTVAIHGRLQYKRVLDRVVKLLALNLTHEQFDEIKESFIWSQNLFKYLSHVLYKITLDALSIV